MSHPLTVELSDATYTALQLRHRRPHNLPRRWLRRPWISTSAPSTEGE